MALEGAQFPFPPPVARLAAGAPVNTAWNRPDGAIVATAVRRNVLRAGSG
ncbi:hypothetical protein IQ782_25100 [Salipiger pacificus]|uniref:Uncharacterized protein n=1 Tax=Salipiger mangrovisoli TaxID=2865933 RepID=A0ABR9X9I1_9RHOB|nr:hypothetical protein [Salipiger mangrovisoli]